jgi:hypothetical protein
MENDWVKFFELVGRLQAVSPGLVDLALKYGQRKNREVLEEVERELESQSGGEKPREAFFEHSQATPRVNLRSCQDFLGKLRRQEDDLRDAQVKTAQELTQIQAARRAFEETLKEMLLEERQSFASDYTTVRCATEEEILAGLQELKEKGGLELHEFIGELEQGLNGRERTGS